MKSSCLLSFIILPLFVLCLNGCEELDPACVGAVTTTDQWNPSQMEFSVVDNLNVSLRSGYTYFWTFYKDWEISNACGSSLIDVVCTVAYDISLNDIGKILPFLVVDNDMVTPVSKKMIGNKKANMAWSYVNGFDKATPAGYKLKIGFMVFTNVQFPESGKLELISKVKPCIQDMRFTVEYRKLSQ